MLSNPIALLFVSLLIYFNTSASVISLFSGALTWMLTLISRCSLVYFISARRLKCSLGSVTRISISDLFFVCCKICQYLSIPMPICLESLVLMFLSLEIKYCFSFAWTLLISCYISYSFLSCHFLLYFLFFLIMSL